MVQLTEQAGTILLASLQASGIGPEQGLRLTTEGGSFSLEVDSPTDEDRVIEHNDTPVLILDKGVEAYLGDSIIDLTSGPEGPRLTIRRPDQKSE